MLVLSWFSFLYLSVVHSNKPLIYNQGAFHSIHYGLLLIFRLMFGLSFVFFKARCSTDTVDAFLKHLMSVFVCIIA